MARPSSLPFTLCPMLIPATANSTFKILKPRGGREGIETHSKYDYIFLPKDTVHQITVKEAPVKVVIIHPERQE